jgi:acetyltransferase
MSTYRLSNVLAPRSVALVGASPRQGSLGAAILKNITEGGFAGQIGLVNPRYGEIAGIKTSSIRPAGVAPPELSSSVRALATDRDRFRKQPSEPRGRTTCA